jgi:hypothetical protein
MFFTSIYLARGHPTLTMASSMSVLRREAGRSVGLSVVGLSILEAHCCFHRKLREELREGRVTYIHHKIMGITDDLEALYATEEWLVRGHWSDARRLNMIPGGKSGLKYLRENVVPMPDERDRLLEAWLRENPRRGLPAPWVLGHCADLRAR